MSSRCDGRRERRDEVTGKAESEPAADEPSINNAVAERLADTMFALSTPSRVLILGSLLGGPRSVSDLTESLGMEQSAVSHQLRVLREHDLVRADKAGRQRLYVLYDEHVRALLYAGLHHVERAHRPSRISRSSRVQTEPGVL
jgi:DNA-binding transcriptional ArsR family regulator